MYVVAVTKNGVRRWVPVARSSNNLKKVVAKQKRVNVARRVYIVDNGSVPFVVEFDQEEPSDDSPGIARVWHLRTDVSDDHPDWYRNIHDDPIGIQQRLYKPWRDFQYSGAWIGYDPEERQEKTSFWRGLLKNGPAWWYGGNTVLLRLTGNHHLVIQENIYKFDVPADDKIIQYVSIMGNSAVPYPFAVGKKNTYLTLEKAVVSNHKLDSLRPKLSKKWITTMTTDNDPYGVYYDFLKKKETQYHMVGIKVLHHGEG
jgi:hypothetical protein